MVTTRPATLSAEDAGRWPGRRWTRDSPGETGGWMADLSREGVTLAQETRRCDDLARLVGEHGMRRDIPLDVAPTAIPTRVIRERTIGFFY